MSPDAAIANIFLSPEGLDDPAPAVSGAEVRAYFGALLAERKARPQDDLLSDLIAVGEAGDTLSEGEVIAVSILLFAAGFETTTNLIGNGPPDFARVLVSS